MERFAGKTADEVLGRPALEVFPFLREHGLDLALARALEGESVVTNGVVHIEPDGTRKVYDRLYEPIRSQGGEVTGVLCIVKDATARYAAIDALRASDAKLRMAVEAAGVGFWSWDPETDVAAWESTMCEIFGVQPESAPTTLEGYLAIVHPDDRHRVVERVGGRNVAGAWEDEYRIVRPDGVRWIMSKIGVVHVDGKRLVLGAVVDVTSRRERDDRQRAAQHDSKRSGRSPQALRTTSTTCSWGCCRRSRWRLGARRPTSPPFSTSPGHRPKTRPTSSNSS